MKAAAYAEYPNFFNNSCMFFGSIDRDLKLGRPCSILRVSKLALDLAKVLRNLGILTSYQIGQRLDRLGENDYMWQTDLEPEHVSELKLYSYKFLRLNLRWDLNVPAQQQGQAEQQPPAQMPLNMPESLPMSVTNISRPSQPVYYTPRMLGSILRQYPSGIMMMYHPDLGITTDAALDLTQSPGIAMAHLGLPTSHVAQIHSCMKQKMRQESIGAEQPMPLREWNMVDVMQQHLAERLTTLGGPQVDKQKQEIRRMIDRGKKEDEHFISNFDISSTLNKELIAWQLKEKLGQPPSDPRDRLGQPPSDPRHGDDRNRGGPSGSEGRFGQQRGRGFEQNQHAADKGDKERRTAQGQTTQSRGQQGRRGP